MNVEENFKSCSDSNCTVVNPQPLTNFYSYPKQNKKLGEYIYYHPECKVCSARRVKERRIENPEYYQKNIELQRKRNSLPEVKEQRKKWRTSEKGVKQRKEWTGNHKEELKGYNRHRSLHKKHEISNEEWEICKNYFNYRCAYCGLKIEEHWIKYNGKLKLGDFHQEHVDHSGANDLSNCVPSCKVCNSTKHDSLFIDWYNQDNINYTKDRFNKINEWLNGDYKLYIKTSILN